jgi:hypothetical protein
MVDKKKPKITATKAELVKLITDLLDEFEYWNDGCGCCSHNSGKDMDEYRAAAKAVEYYD